ncbi:MAG: hypothetical protein FJZ47_01465 [Candidatus Tectomicrobia bacterium]|uniref:Uncharacterized protein n=1 Tax=Tectimicrobiota bacterium TaxID=2528274 RepID=A0A937VZG5_UNCTE|nr:hypothetical protein [Candidatus Tectomicrobia bacterium]
MDQGLSLYDVTHEIAQTSQGMMMAIPEEAWRIFSDMTVEELVTTLCCFAQHVRLTAYRQSTRGPKKPHRKPPGNPKIPHVSTAKLLQEHSTRRLAHL